MNYKIYIERSDKAIEKMSFEELRECIREIGRRIPENNREKFLSILETAEANEEKTQKVNSEYLFKSRFDEKRVTKMMNKINADFEKIEEGELYLSASGYEDYSDGYGGEWRYDYDDPMGIGRILCEAAGIAHDLINDDRCKEALYVYRKLMDVNVIASDKWGDDDLTLDIEEMEEERLININLDTLAHEIMYAEYRVQAPEKIAEILYGYFSKPFFRNIHVENMFSVGRKALADIDVFLESWIDFLTVQPGDEAARLLKEAILLCGGIDKFYEVAQKSYEMHPSIYTALLEEYERNHDYHTMETVGVRAMEQLDTGLKIRGRVSLLTSKAAYYNGNYQLMRKCWYEAFTSDSDTASYLRNYVDEQSVKEYGGQLKKTVLKLKISEYRDYKYNENEMLRNEVFEIEYKYLGFFAGEFDKVREWCMEQKEYLGWSGHFVGHGIELMLLYLYNKREMDKGIRTIANGVASMIFNEKGSMIFMRENITTDAEVTSLNKAEIFWEVFLKWKKYHPMTKKESDKYAFWLEDIIDKRIDAIVRGGFRGKYGSVTILAAGIGEALESLELIASKKAILDKYHNRFKRHSSFRGALREYE